MTSSRSQKALRRFPHCDNCPPNTPDSKLAESCSFPVAMFLDCVTESLRKSPVSSRLRTIMIIFCPACRGVTRLTHHYCTESTVLSNILSALSICFLRPVLYRSAQNSTFVFHSPTPKFLRPDRRTNIFFVSTKYRK
jgi:hypothetical protein